LLNGVKVDVLAAACFGVGNERTGCNDVNQPWRFDPMHGPNGFNVDMNNAHAQPDGAYHYHGPPPIFNGDSETAGDPGGPYDGTYRDDYEYVAGQGDLDACNGMSVNGQYGYYVTTGFPYLVGCYTGTPDASFLKR